MQTHRLASLVTILVAAVAMSAAPGCEHDSASASSGGSDPAGSDFFARYAKAVCGHTFACCDAAVRAAHDLKASSADECSSQFEAVLKAFSGGGVVNGTYAPAKGDACLAEVEVAPCADVQIIGALLGVNDESVPSCLDAYDGSAPEGGSCTTDWDCARDRCVRSIDSGGQMTSACKARGALGEACESSFDCDEALRCDQPSSSSVGTCATRIALGGSCEGSSGCAQELRCAQDSTCQPREQKGGPCMSDEDCVSGLTCEGSTCAPLGAAGAPCSYDSDCASFACVKATSTCADVCKGS